MARRLHGKVHRIFREEELHLLPALIAAADLGLHAADNFPDLLKRIGDLSDLMRAAVAWERAASGMASFSRRSSSA